MKSYFKSHISYFTICSIIWITAVIAGIYISVSGKAIPGSEEYINRVYSSPLSFGTVFFNGAGTNIRFAVLLYITSSFAYLTPLTAALVAFKGFSSGYTSGAIIHCFGAKGCLINLAVIVIPMVFSLPVLLTMCVSGLESNVSLIKPEKHGKLSSAGIRINLLKQLIILTIALIPINILEGAISVIIK